MHSRSMKYTAQSTPRKQGQDLQSVGVFLTTSRKMNDALSFSLMLMCAKLPRIYSVEIWLMASFNAAGPYARSQEAIGKRHMESLAFAAARNTCTHQRAVCRAGKPSHHNAWRVDLATGSIKYTPDEDALR